MMKRKFINNNTNASKRRQNNQQLSLQESEVFISEYLNPFPGFNGVLKERYSDFQVNEIDLDGNVIRLTDLTVPEFSSLIPETEYSGDDCALISEDQWSQLFKLVEETKEDVVRIEVSHLDKSERQQVHHSIRARFNSKLLTKTVSNTDDSKFIEVGLAKKSDERNSWIDTLPKYLHFVVYKENMDTTELISSLASKLRVKSNMIMHAGTKDKRGKTVQRMAVRQIKVSLFVGLNMRNVRFGNFCYKDLPIKLGDLRGNRFRVVLRNVSSEETELVKIMDFLKTNGFINYFGLQRFGCYVQSPTYEIGKRLVRKEWKQAVELILSPRSNDPFDLEKAKKIWAETNNGHTAYKCLHRSRLSIEGKVLQALAINSESAYVNALQMIPRHTMFLYGHAYQSLIWNNVVSRRMKEFGRTPICGDLILIKNQPIVADIELADDVIASIEEDLENIVRPITEDELSDIKIEDIVYPLPGYKVRYPKNITADWYREKLDEDGINPENFKQSSWLFSLPGSYRKIINIPEDCNWKIVRYKNPEDDLILSDLDILLDKQLPEDSSEGQYRALYLEMSLPPSSYATMAIREITKQDTSVSYQSSLTTKE